MYFRIDDYLFKKEDISAVKFYTGFCQIYLRSGATIKAQGINDRLNSILNDDSEKQLNG